MATNVSFTRGPAYKIAAEAVKDGQILYATDSKQLFVDQGYNRIQITDILVVDSLPTDSVIVNKLYYVDGDNILAIYDGYKWVQINAQQAITTGSTPGTISVAGVDIPVNGLGTAAYASKGDFDPAGAAGAMIGSTDDSVDAHTILGVRNRVDKAVKDITTQHNTDITTLNTKIDDSISTLDTKIDGSVSTINNTIDSKITEINQTLRTEITNVNTTVDQKISDLSDSVDTKLSTTNQYTIQKLTEAANDSVASYSLYKDGNPIGTQINIPKDYLVKYAELKICKKRNNPPGFETGDQYIDFVINSANEDGNESHVYLNVNDLVDVYEAGDGISIDYNNIVSINIEPGNGFNFENDKLVMHEVTQEANGAMTAVDKKKLDGIEEGAQVNKEYTLLKQRQPNLGYSATYVLYEDNVALGDPINIPEDYVISNVLFAIGNGRVGRIEKGKPYLDITVQNYLQTSNEIHMYCELPMPGNGISIDENNVVVLLKEENGLHFNDVGEIALDLATSTTNGAMSAEDKAKVDAIEGGSQVNIIESASLNGVAGTIDDSKNIDLIFSVNDRGLSLGNDNEIGLKLVPGNGLEYNSTGQFGMQLVNAAKKTHGSMTFSDKAKLDTIEEGSQVNIIESTSLNGVPATVDENKNANLTFSVSNQGLSLGDNNEIGLKLVPGNGIEYNAAGQFTLQTADVGKTRNGAMTYVEKDKLDKIEATAQVNIIESTSLNGVACTIDENKNANLTFSVSDQGLSLGDNNEIGLKFVPGNGLEYNTEGQFGLQLVTPDTRNGAMSMADKTKLDSIEDGSQVNDIEHIMLNGVEAPLTADTKTVDIPLTVNNKGLSIGDNNEIGLKLVPGNGIEYNADGQFGLQLATPTTRNGAMSMTDKKKLDDIESGSQVNIIESASLNGVAGVIDDAKNIDLTFSVNSKGLSLGDNNEIGLKLVPGNGVAYNSEGQFALSLAKPTKEGQAASNGAMSGADKTKVMGQMDINAIAHPFQVLSDTDESLTDVDKSYAPDIATGAVKLTENKVLTMPASEGTSESGTDGYMTASYAKKLEGIEAGSQVNIIENASLNGVAGTIDDNKNINLAFSVNSKGLSLGENNEIGLKIVPGNGLSFNNEGQLGMSLAGLNGAGALSGELWGKLYNLAPWEQCSAPLIDNGGPILRIQEANSTQDGYMTKEYATKLDGIETGAQVNVIEGISLNGVAGTISEGKNANLTLSVNSQGLSLGENNEIGLKIVPGNGIAFNGSGQFGLSLASQSAHGAMSSVDKTKVDNLQSIYSISAPLSLTDNALSIAPATASTNGYMTKEYATKLDGIETGAQVNIIESIQVGNTNATIASKKATIPLSVGSQGLSLGDNNEITFKYVPGNGLKMNDSGQLGLLPVSTTENGAMLATDKVKLNSLQPVYTISAPLSISSNTLSIAPATASANGYMTKEYATKLNGIETGAQVNVIESIQVGNTNATISGKKATIPLSVTSNGLSLGDNNEIGFKYVPGNGLAMNASGSLGMSLATQSAHGAMSSTDKTKLDSLKSIYTVSAPLSFSGTTLSMVSATASRNGYMTSTQASKLDGIASGAQVNVLEGITFAGKTVNITNKQAAIPFSVKQECLSLGTNNELSFLYTPGNGLAINADHSLGMTLATQSAAGAMSANDKKTLDNISSGMVKKYSTTIGNNSTTTFTLTHNLNQPHVMVSAFNNQGEGVWLNYKILNSTQVQVTFNTPPATNSITVVVIG